MKTHKTETIIKIEPIDNNITFDQVCGLNPTCSTFNEVQTKHSAEYKAETLIDQSRHVSEVDDAFYFGIHDEMVINQTDNFENKCRKSESNIINLSLNCVKTEPNDKEFGKETNELKRPIIISKKIDFTCNSYKHSLDKNESLYTETKPALLVCVECFTENKHSALTTTSKIVNGYKCSECEKIFVQNLSLLEHIHHLHRQILFECDECNKTFIKKHYLIDHIDLHRKSQISVIVDVVCLKLQILKCNECCYNTSHKSHLQRHINAVHRRIRNFTCSECDHSSATKAHLQKHIYIVHWKLKNIKCSECQYISSNKLDLQRHVDGVHRKIKSLRCNECDYRSSWISTLKVHINRVHRKIKSFRCSECNYESFVKSSLNAHISRVHLNIKKFKCSECDYMCSWRASLSAHINRVHLKLKSFICSECNYATVWKSGLRVHINRLHRNVGKTN